VVATAVSLGVVSTGAVPVGAVPKPVGVSDLATANDPPPEGIPPNYEAMFAELRQELAVLRARFDATADEIRTKRIVVADDDLVGQDVDGYDVGGYETIIEPGYAHDTLERTGSLSG
jgi:hypothetical protein